MSNDILRFEFGTLTEFISPTGTRFLRGEIEGMKITLIPEPLREPAQDGVMRWSVWASPAPGRARHVKPPAIPAPDQSAVSASARPSQKARQQAAVEDILHRYGRINDLGDPLPPALSDREREPALSEEPDLLHTPLF